MAKKSKKVKAADIANVATQNVVEEVFGSSPVGIEWNVGVDPAVRDAFYAAQEAAKVGKGNGGPKEAEIEKAIEMQAVEIPVGGFNRAGLDAMLEERVGPEVVVNVAQKVTKKGSRIKLSGGYRGTVRQMLIDGETGEAIIKKIASMYQEKGMSYEYGFDRGKRILGDMELELKRGVFSKEESA